MLLGLGLLSYIPLLLTHQGMVGADTKHYLYLDPSRMLAQAPSMWDPNVGLGTVTHQNIGYLLPMGPWYWSFRELGVPVWIAERLWTGSLLFLAGCGALWLARLLGLSRRGGMVMALAFALTPYSLEYEARISAILMPWAALPWFVGLAVLALRRGGWRYPAIFALVVALVGGVNATCLLYAGLAPVLWFPFAVLVDRSASWRQAAAAVMRIGVLTILGSLWWMSGLLTQAGYGLDVLRYTETVEVVSQTSLPLEVVRGLGNWYFYGRDAIGPWIQPAGVYTQRLPALAISYLVPVLAFAAGALSRWRYRLYFVALVAIGVAIAVGVHPYDHPSPLGGLFKAFAGSSSAGLALRSVGRAVPLVALGTSALLGSGCDALVARLDEARPSGARAGRPGSFRSGGQGSPFGSLGTLLSGGLALLCLANLSPLFIGQFVDQNLQRPEHLPAYWPAVAGYLDGRGAGTRVLELPGADFSHYRWGATLDPVTPGLMDRPFVSRELIPYGSPASADLIRALDRRLQEGTFEPTSLAPLAKLLSVGDVVLRSDLQFERFRTPRPRPTWQLFQQAIGNGIQAPTAFGPAVPTAPEVDLTDEITLATRPTDPDPPAVAVFGVEGTPAIVRAEPAGRPLLVAGDAEGLVDLASAGILDRRLASTSGPVLFSAAMAGDPVALRAALDAGADLVVTDTNRRRGQRWGTIQDVNGYTEQAGEDPLVADPTDARLPVFPGAGDDAFTVAEQRGVQAVRATAYGNPVSFEPGHRPDQALDGDTTTAWTVGAFSDVVGERLRIDLAAPVTTDQLTLVQPLTGPRERFVTKATITFDRGEAAAPVPVHVDLSGPESRTTAGQLIHFTNRTFRRVDITIDAMNFGRRADYSGGSGVGFAEVRIPGIHVEEFVRLPVDLLAAAGSDSATHALALVMTRMRANRLESFKVDEELGMARTFTLPTARAFTLAGTARLSGYATDPVLDQVLHRGAGEGDPSATASDAQAGNLAAHAPAAIDEDPTTAWQPSFGDQESTFLQVNTRTPVTFDHLDLRVVADGRHSVPTRLLVEIPGGESRTVDVPQVTDDPGEQHVAIAPVHFPALTGSAIKVTVLAVRAVRDENYFSKVLQTLPVGIAELGIPGVSAPLVGRASDISDPCRDDLVTIDGRPLRVQIVGSPRDGIAALPLKVVGCDGDVRLGPGPHDLRTRFGRDTGIDLDRLVLSSPAPTVAPVAAPPQVTVVHQGRTSLTARVDGATVGQRFWFVLGQSHNAGWHATARGHDLGAASLVDGYANGWLIRPDTAGSFTVSLVWTPQATVVKALAASGVTLVILLGVALTPILTRHRHRHRHRKTAPARTSKLGKIHAEFAGIRPSFGWSMRSSGRSGWLRAAAHGAAAGVGAGLLIQPLAGVVVGAAVVSAVRTGRRAWLGVTGAGLLALAGLYVVQLQFRYRFPAKLDWPSRFEKVDGLTWVAIALWVAGAVLTHRSDTISTADDVSSGGAVG